VHILLFKEGRLMSFQTSSMVFFWCLFEVWWRGVRKGLKMKVLLKRNTLICCRGSCNCRGWWGQYLLFRQKCYQNRDMSDLKSWLELRTRVLGFSIKRISCCTEYQLLIWD
jgi:hypothetical protein